MGGRSVYDSRKRKIVRFPRNLQGMGPLKSWRNKRAKPWTERSVGWGRQVLLGPDVSRLGFTQRFITAHPGVPWPEHFHAGTLQPWHAATPKKIKLVKAAGLRPTLDTFYPPEWAEGLIGYEAARALGRCGGGFRSVVDANAALTIPRRRGWIGV